MLDYNLIKPRCLIITSDQSLLTGLETLLSKTGVYIIDVATDRKSALLNFLQYRHTLVLIDEEFLPRFPHRLHQFCKAAHRTPGIIIFRRSEKELSGYCFLTDGIVEIIDVPFKSEALMLTLKQTDHYMRLHSRSIFFKDMLVHTGLAVPILILLAVLLKLGL